MADFYCKKDQSSIESFKEDIRKYASEKELDIQEGGENETEWFFQMKKDSKYTLGVGAKAVTTVIEEFSEDTIKIRVGEGKWLSKLAGGALAGRMALTSVPLFLLTAVVTATGIIKQGQLELEVEEFVKLHFQQR